MFGDSRKTEWYKTGTGLQVPRWLFRDGGRIVPAGYHVEAIEEIADPRV
jgi:hypothetical protein